MSRARLGGHELPPAPTVAQRHAKKRPGRKSGDRLLAWLDHLAPEPEPITYAQACMAARLISRRGFGSGYIARDAWLLLLRVHGMTYDSTGRSCVMVDLDIDGVMTLYCGVDYVTQGR